ncbi:MAG: methyltransferase domain-containing protein [Patescibacteria group bacterium]|nr:methyltransferase domain-containing protein [Patescibacteria group bacterium]
MGIIKRILLDKEYEEKKAEYGLDAPEMTIYHREIILRKRFIKKLYLDWYADILAKIDTAGKVLELGSGGGFLKDVAPSIITSDILPLPNCDMTVNAYRLPFADKELAAIIMIDTLHHMGECHRFFTEAERALRQGGKIIMIEPANTAWSRFVYHSFHHEPFNENAAEWNFPSAGPMSMANGALPWIVFTRDKLKFEADYPNFKIAPIRRHTPFRYPLSGGLSYKSLLPGWLHGAAKLTERLLSPFNQQLAMFQTIEITKT